MRERCYQCFRPKPFCYCREIPTIDNRTHVLILQHVAERFHPFNTARIVHKALDRCELIAEPTTSMALRSLPLRERVGLLYPSPDARLLDTLPPAERPEQLVIVDGTWHQAKTVVRDVPQLQVLPCFKLSPTSPGQYRIRREPNASSLSTLEATVAALRSLEPHTVGFDQLMAAFHKMIDDQLGHPISHAVWRKKKSRGTKPRDVPRAFLKDVTKLVIAYGEATPGGQNRRTARPVPVNWFAQRYGTGDEFSCLLQQPTPLSETSMHHMGLCGDDFRNAVSADDFREQWSAFLQANDTLVVYHENTARLLDHIDAKRPPCVVLKSIFGKRWPHIHSMDDLLWEQVAAPGDSEVQPRALQRLKNAIALVNEIIKGIETL